MLIIRHAWLNLLDKHMITGRKANIEEGIAEKWGRGFGQFTDLSGEGWVGGGVLEGGFIPQCTL